MNSLFKAKKELNQKLAKKEHQRDEDNRIIVDMTVQNDDNFLSAYSASNRPTVSSEVAEFIENRTLSLPPKEQLTLRIHTSCIDDEEKILYKDAIAEHFTESYAANETELKRNFFVSIFLAITGILVLMLAIILNTTIGDSVWTEVVDIVAWVFLWEATYLYFLENRGLKHKRMRYLALISMKVEYVSKSETDRAKITAMSTKK